MARDVPMSTPYFTTNEKNTYKAQVGSSVILLCQVENLGKCIIIFFIDFANSKFISSTFAS